MGRGHPAGSRRRCRRLTTAGIKPGLAVVLVGENPASQVYVRSKHKACDEVGMQSETTACPPTTPQAELLALIDRLNADRQIHGILVQLPLPEADRRASRCSAASTRRRTWTASTR